MRYASRAVLSAPEKTLTKLILELPELINNSLNFYKELLKNLEEEDQDVPHHESIISLFIESA